MSKKRHRNSLDNDEPHHLYAIHDKKNREVFKYGISSDPIDEDGWSDRVRDQVNFFNLIAGWIRFFAEIIKKNIAGRREARKIEDQHIEEFKKKHGRKPRGNRQ